MFETIDILARVVGYGAIAYAVLWLVQKSLEERGEAKLQQLRRSELDDLAKRDPAAHSRELGRQRDLEIWRAEKRTKIAELRRELGDDS